MSRNLLDQETSPYLLLHKDNPVHWRPWSAEALEEARSSGKPILLSIGYTACHWCHVMNGESFADPETAALINENFIAILVDREERPDLDQIYQAAANTLGHQGGWPLTIFLTPQADPYYAGGYFPKEAQPNQPPFNQVVSEVARIYREQPEPVAQTVDRIQQAFAAMWSRDLRGPVPQGILDELAVRLGQRFDIFYGGLTGMPKFPSTGPVEILWRAYLRTGVEQFNQLVQGSLTNMSMGGIYDHIGGGYMRYSTDDRWIIPHFEKMLYDNALITDILTLVYQGTRAPLYRDRIAETIGWVLREMRAEKGFATSIDSDSEGEEGKYYLWTEAEVDEALKGTFAQRFKDIFEVSKTGNFQGRNVIHRLGKVPGYPLADSDEALIAKQKGLLLAARQKRVAPIRDDKVLADCNGMMIATLANASGVFKNREWLSAATSAFDFICQAMGEGDRLYHSWRAGERGALGFAEDYAFMARAALALHEATSEARYLDRAQVWTRMLNEHFWDMQNGGYFTTSDEAEPLIARVRMSLDQVIPSANGVMVGVLGKLFHLTTDQFYRDRANALIQAFSGEIVRIGPSMPTFLNGLDTVISAIEIVVIGHSGNAKRRELVDAVNGRSLPGRVLVVLDPGQQLPDGHPARGKEMQDGQPTAYICQNGVCSPPVTNPVALSQMLQLPPRPQAAQQQMQQQAANLQPAGKPN